MTRIMIAITQGLILSGLLIGCGFSSGRVHT